MMIYKNFLLNEFNPRSQRDSETQSTRSVALKPDDVWLLPDEIVSWEKWPVCPAIYN